MYHLFHVLIFFQLLIYILNRKNKKEEANNEFESISSVGAEYRC